MDYVEARNKIKSGDVLAWTHLPAKTWYDFKIHVVRAVTESEYSHVAIAYRLSNRLFALESVTAGVRIYPLSRMGNFYWIPGDELTDEQEIRAMSVMGEPYSQIEGIKAELGLGTEFENHLWECAEFVNFVKGWNIKHTPTTVVNNALKYASLTSVTQPETYELP